MAFLKLVFQAERLKKVGQHGTCSRPLVGRRELPYRQLNLIQVVPSQVDLGRFRSI